MTMISMKKCTCVLIKHITVNNSCPSIETNWDNSPNVTL